MKSFVAFALLIAGVSASTIRLHEKRILREEPILVRALERAEPVLHLKKHIPILSLKNEIRGAESNDLEYHTANGISVSEHTQSVPGVRSVYRDESGELVESDSSLVKTGSYSYISPEGIPITTTYIADENGFRVIGDHLPKPVELLPEHAELHREVLARVGLVDVDAPHAPLLLVNEEVAPIRIKAHRHSHKPSHLRHRIPQQTTNFHFEI